MAQSVKRLTLGFGSGHDLTVGEFKLQAPDSVEPAWGSLSPSLSASPLLVLAVSLKMNKLFFFFKAVSILIFFLNIYLFLEDRDRV